VGGVDGFPKVVVARSALVCRMPTGTVDDEGAVTTKDSRSWGILTWYLRNENAQMSPGTRMGCLHRLDLPGGGGCLGLRWV